MLRQVGKDVEALSCLAATHELDPLDNWSRYLPESRTIPRIGQQRLDLAFDLAAREFPSRMLRDVPCDTNQAESKRRIVPPCNSMEKLAHVYHLLGCPKESQNRPIGSQLPQAPGLCVS